MNVIFEKEGKNMGRYERLIFVCTENTTRSPMAEAIYNSMQIGNMIEVLSRGLVVLFPEPMNPKAEVVLNNHELQISEHIAKQFRSHEVDEHTLILTMTMNEKIKIEEEYFVNSNVYTLKEYAGESGDVSDPYGGTLLEYEECFGELLRLVKKAAYRIDKENNE